MLAKLHNDENDKNKDYEQEIPRTALYNKCKGIKIEFSSHKPDTSREESVKHHRKQQESSESSDDNKKKRKYITYEEIFGEFKKIKLAMFNGEVEKGKEAEPGCLELKKYFQIYNYSDECKAKIPIYNLTGMADIWWKDINKVKGIKRDM